MLVEIDQGATQLESVDLDDDLDVAATTMALLNPLILQKVLSSLDVPTLKSVRLVCTLWADVGAAYLGKKGCLVFWTPRNRINYDALACFNPELGRNVELLFYTYKFCCFSTICTCCTHLPANFVIILPEISDKLETLKFVRIKAFEPLQELWSTYQFPNLTQIWITADGDYLDKKAPPPDMAQFRPLPNLKVVFLRIPSSPRKYLSRALISAICQNLVNAAPNLEEFDLDTIFCLDLTPCRKLKRFMFQYYAWGSLESEISGMTKMLKSCPNSLETLSWEYFGWDADAIELNFRFPNLTHLRLTAADGFILKDSLSVAHLPKLTHFSLLAYDTTFEHEISAMLENYRLPHDGITSLDISVTHYPEIDNEDGETARKLVNFFPSVKEFKFKLGVKLVQDFDQYFASLMETLRSFGDWGLTCGDVEVEIPYFYQQHEIDGPYDHDFGSLLVIAVLGGMTGWRGLTNTTLQFTANHRRHAEFRLLDEMLDALLSCRTIRSVTITGFLMDEETNDNLRTFIGEHNLPISVAY